jgi:hypothetical protein
VEGGGRRNIPVLRPVYPHVILCILDSGMPTWGRGEKEGGKRKGKRKAGRKDKRKERKTERWEARRKGEEGGEKEKRR